MEKRKKEKVNFHSIIIKFLLVFLLFGTLLVLVSISIQKDLGETTTENLAIAQETLSLSLLEKNIGNGDWSVREHTLYKGETPIGNGTADNANTAPFIQTQNESDSFVYSFIDSSLADQRVLDTCSANGKEVTAFLRVAGSTLSSSGESIVGTFLEQSVSDELEKNDTFAGASFVEGSTYYCYYKVLRDANGQRLGAIVAGRSIDEIALNTRNSARNSSLAIVVIILYTLFALFLFVVKWNRSIKRMEAYLTEIGSGTLPEKPLKISGGDELSEMADVINEMKLSLKEKERLRNELELARTIQAEMLPDESAALQLPESCRVKGLMIPAREVGGDLYDFFMIDKDHLGLVIADVSDKGAPAALFMATAKTCLKDNIMLGAEPAAVLSRVNNTLLSDNRSGLFVTAWIGILDLSTGHLSYAMAGHPFPYFRTCEKEAFQKLKGNRNLVLAGLPDFSYAQDETVLSPGARLFLFTDGLDEARDVNENFFGKERIESFLNEHTGDSIYDTVSGIKSAVDTFAIGREQFDDLTILMLEYTGGQSHE